LKKIEENTTVVEVCDDLYEKVLQSTESHAISFYKGTLSSSPKPIMGSVKELLKKLKNKNSLLDLIAPSLDGATIDLITRDVWGKISGYFTSHRPFAGLLYYNFHYDLEPDSIILYNEDPKKRLTAGAFSVDSIHSSIIQKNPNSDGVISNQLMKNRVKLDLNTIATTNIASGRQEIESVEFDGKRFSVPANASRPLPIAYQWPSSVDEKNVKLLASPVKGHRMKNGGFVMNIPLHAQRNPAGIPSQYESLFNL
jgi:hypothetical protein